jgi:hypothetical protein
VTCREQLEIEFLRRLMKRDAGIFADRTAALDNLVAREPVRRINSTYASEHPTRPSETIFDGCYSIGRP